MTRVLHTARARRDLIDIWLEVSSDDAGAADDLYHRLEARAEVLKRFPKQVLSGRILPPTRGPQWNLLI